MAHFIGDDYMQIWAQVRSYLENPPPIASGGGTYCIFCQSEVCRIIKHRNPQVLAVIINKLILDLIEVR
jgi:hypothetical protein